MRENKKGVPTVAAVENAEKQTLNHSVGVQAATDNIPFLEPHLKHIMELLPLGQATIRSIEAAKREIERLEGAAVEN